MSLLFKNLRVHQVFGANTDVGKTILTSALVRASAAKKNQVFYLKPVSTGPLQDADDEHVKRYAGPHRALVNAHCLYRFDEPRKEGARNVVVPTDDAFITSVASYIRKCASDPVTERSHMYVETAGGVHSPTLSGTTQLDSYRPLFLPTILVGDSRLGGISSTISAYESLSLRGYIVDSVLLFQDEYYRNWEYLEPYFAERGVKVSTVDPPPPREADPGRNFIVTEEYYNKITSEHNTGGLLNVIELLDERHEGRIKELHSMPQRTLNTVWWPFVQHGLIKHEGDPSSPSAASSVSLLESQFDGSASWWTQTLGHAHPALTLAAARAAGRYGHVMYPQATYAPALRLAERLVHEGPGKGWASRAFISDNGSTGMEIALKMALRVASKKFGFAPQEQKKLGVLGLKGSYHGDTIGAMDACEEGVYSCEWHEAKGYWFEPPSIGIKNGRAFIEVPSAIAPERVEGQPLSWIYNVSARLGTSLATAYRKHIDMALRKWRIMVPLFTGLWRLGLRSAAPLLGAYPDVSVYAKILTGGMAPLAVTLASDDVFRAFEGTSKTEALLHGHSYTAYAIGCEIANETLDQLEGLARGDSWKAAQVAWKAERGEKEMEKETVVDGDRAVWSLWSPQFVDALSKLGIIDQVMSLGTVLAFKVTDNDAGALFRFASPFFVL
ncbi:onanonoxo-7-onima-8-eninoihtemlysoneda [Multifurca ochricompacta]|uniref:Onanonoxo-7-onima-8-eninoihtemlysoneda n=1 Tax=Multifurca ochricompacta TaxID=376703 RepID=A0AAD4QJ43_9AGAM|nr:onanonoxo-7-onima-8-eninoihtemlysoneda [Multifurca ochricompacta]